MDLKKLKKESSSLNQSKKSTAKTTKVTKTVKTVKTDSKKTSSKGIKSTLKVESYNNKYKGQADVFQDNAGTKKLNTGKWSLKSAEAEDESIDNPADSKLNFYDENGNEVAMQG